MRTNPAQVYRLCILPTNASNTNKRPIMKYFSIAILIASTFAFNTVDTVFFASEDNSTVYADFAALDTQVDEVWVFQNDESVFQDNTADLADDVIYELDIKAIGEGTYDVELHLADGTVVTHAVTYRAAMTLLAESE